jgi:hypothetical protein
MEFENLEMVKEYPKWFLNRTLPLRVYRTHDEPKKGEKITYRWHFGYPEKVIKPFCPLIETTIYWGEPHWTEHEGFWLWWLPFTTESKELPMKELNEANGWRRRSLGECLKFLQRM